jgi:hypothetical protein
MGINGDWLIVMSLALLVIASGFTYAVKKGVIIRKPRDPKHLKIEAEVLCKDANGGDEDAINYLKSIVANDEHELHRYVGLVLSAEEGPDKGKMKWAITPEAEFDTAPAPLSPGVSHVLGAPMAE